MTTRDGLLWKLHVRQARGEPLTSAEQTQLNAWYAEQDEAEVSMVGSNWTSGNLDPLKQQIDAVLKRIATTSQMIQTVTAENENLRQENAALRRQLARYKTLQPA